MTMPLLRSLRTRVAAAASRARHPPAPAYAFPASRGLWSASESHFVSADGHRLRPRPPPRSPPVSLAGPTRRFGTDASASPSTSALGKSGPADTPATVGDDDGGVRVDRVAASPAAPEPGLLDSDGAGGGVGADDEEEEEMEQEDMFVEADPCLGHGRAEWGGPRRGGRLAEPTRFGDWERKGRCTDF